MPRTLTFKGLLVTHFLVQNRTNSNDDLLTPSEEINDKSITLGSKGYILRRFDWGSLIPGRIILTCHHNKGSKHIFPQIHINKDKKAKEAINFVKFQNENFAKMQLSGDFHLVNVMIDIIKTLEETHEVDCSKTFHYSISTAEDCGARIIIMDLRKHKRPQKTWPNETLKILSYSRKLRKKKLSESLKRVVAQKSALFPFVMPATDKDILRQATFMMRFKDTVVRLGWVWSEFGDVTSGIS